MEFELEDETGEETESTAAVSPGSTRCLYDCTSPSGV